MGTVSFDLGGAGGTLDALNVRVGESIGELPTPTRTGYSLTEAELTASAKAGPDAEL